MGQDLAFVNRDGNPYQGYSFFQAPVFIGTGEPNTTSPVFTGLVVFGT
jgi:hypothetical protein